jgi:hypothetical protein
MTIIKVMKGYMHFLRIAWVDLKDRPTRIDVMISRRTRSTTSTVPFGQHCSTLRYVSSRIQEYTHPIPLPTNLESTTPLGSPLPSVTVIFPPHPLLYPTRQHYPLHPLVPVHGDAGPNASPPKRRYVPDAADVEVAKKIRQSEVELRDHNTVLRVIKNNVIPYVLIHGTTHADVLIELFFLSQCVCCQAQMPERGQKDWGSGTHCDPTIKHRCLLPSQTCLMTVDDLLASGF